MTDLASMPSRVRQQFERNFAEFGELGASVSVWKGETEICTLHGGFRNRAKTVPWDARTLVPVWSATKGAAAACVLTALHDRGLGPESPTGAIWPELGQGLVHNLPIGDLLAHQGGFCALDETPAMKDYPEVIRSLERQAPLWPAGGGHGYHPRTFGFLTDELVRRLAGQPLGSYWRTRIADGPGLDLWIGLPASEDSRVAEVLPPAQGTTHPESVDFYHALAIPGSLTHLAFRSPRGIESVREINQPETRRLSLPSLGGIASAQGLAKFYAILAQGGTWAGLRVIPSEVCRWAEQVRGAGPDRVLLNPTAFSAGFMKDPPTDLASGAARRFGPSPRAFGHPGAGGCHAFADPDGQIGFAYVMNQMERSIFPTRKALSLIQCVYEA